MNTPGSDLLARFERVQLGHFPTPLEPWHRLQAEIGGPLVWAKRDDCSGLAIGGNKTRKLEFLLGKALAEGADTVVTFGALQSNHARQTAAACARVGLGCELILTRAVARTDEHYLGSGNLLLDRILGAHVHIVDDPDAAFERFVEMTERAETDGRQLFGIAPGGSDATGVLGYVAATVELTEQLRSAQVAPTRLVVAASTAGTAAGLVLGSAVAGLGAPLDVACVYEPAAVTATALEALIAAGADTLGIGAPHPDRWRITDRTLGEGYGIPTEDAQAAIALVARTEGVLLDPVYTAKAFAHLLRGIHDGELGDTGDVVFIHTGGSPGLFAYAPEFGADDGAVEDR